MDRGEDKPAGRIVTVTAPARLHLGMFSFGRVGVPAFGGLGWMIDRPATRVRVSDAARLECVGPDARRVRQAVDRLIASGMVSKSLECRIETLDTPPPHVGLGTGTQLALAVGRALLAWSGRDDVSTERLSIALGRARRSAVGTYGFDRGGMIVETGRNEGEAIGRLVARVDLPAEWRFALFIPTDDAGLSGESEQQAFERLPPVPLETTAELQRLALAEIVPAAQENDFDRFAEAVYQYGHLAGSCFAAVQGGPYRSAATAALVQELRDRGIRGVGQSSWGPVVFAAFASAVLADEFVRRFGNDASMPPMTTIVAAPNGRGATVVVAGDR